MRRALQDEVTALDPEFGRMAEEVRRRAWSLAELTMREKAFVFVAADLCSHNVLFPLETHVITALANGVGIDDMREAIRHLAPYAGYPTAVEALICLVELENATAGAGHAPTRAQRPSHADLPEQITEEVRRLDDEFAALLEEQFADRWRRGNLTVRERALCTIAADVVNGTLDESFALHVQLALGAGASEEQVRAVLLIVAEYGIAKSWRAYAALGDLPNRGR